MIITKKKALNIVSTAAVIKDIPALHPIFEAAKAKITEAGRKERCTTCQANNILSDISDKALSAIINLSEDDLQKLKKTLSINEPIYAYTSTQTGVNLKKLG